MGDTAISWTDKTWNPTSGCTRVSPGCKNCYAFALHDMRHEAYLAGKAVPPQYARPFRELQLLPDRLEDPLHWRKPCRVFVNSVSDLFHEDVPDDFIDRVFAVMALTPRHSYQVLTKRAERMRRYFTDPEPDSGDPRTAGIEYAAYALGVDNPIGWLDDDRPLPNVWLGVSAENQQYADERIPHLLATPAAVRFVSYEPALGPLDLTPYLPCPRSNGTLAGYWYEMDPDTPRVRWVIAGGESGPGHRPCEVEWFADVARQCADAGVATFVKQDSGPRPGTQGRIPDHLWALKEFPR